MPRNNLNEPRLSCKDMWNAFMMKDCIFSPNSDIPFCPCKINQPPKKLISYDDAKSIYKKEMHKKNSNFYIDSFIHFYIDDQKFDGKKSSIWLYPYKALKIIKHFSGIITPDFSTNVDFPDPVKRHNTLRMRAFGYWIDSHGIPVINNVRWGTVETWDYCFDGIPKNSIVSIGTVASGLKHLENRSLFESGFNEMCKRLSPHTIIIYGSANYDFFKELHHSGITIISFPSKTSLVFERGNEYE